MTTSSQATMAGKLTEATKQLWDAYEAEANADVAYLYVKEELRAAEGNSTAARVSLGTLGKNAEERRAQLDLDCGAERNRMIDAEAETIRQTARRKGWEARHSCTLALLGYHTRLVDQSE